MSFLKGIIYPILVILNNDVMALEELDYQTHTTYSKLSYSEILYAYYLPLYVLITGRRVTFGKRLNEAFQHVADRYRKEGAKEKAHRFYELKNDIEYQFGISICVLIICITIAVLIV